VRTSFGFPFALEIPLRLKTCLKQSTYYSHTSSHHKMCLGKTDYNTSTEYRNYKATAGHVMRLPAVKSIRTFKGCSGHRTREIITRNYRNMHTLKKYSFIKYIKCEPDTEVCFERSSRFVCILHRCSEFSIFNQVQRHFQRSFQLIIGKKKV
jgi:hypothetical protein